MPLPIDNAIRLAERRINAMASLDVVYKRKLDSGYTRLSMRAVKIEAGVDLDAGDGTVITRRVTQWRIHAAALAVDGSLVRPEPGDQIEVLEGSRLRTYEVMNLVGDAAWEPIAGGQGYRIHTKLIEET